jgi:hypothetical protein
MIHIHGWAVIRESFREEDDDPSKLSHAVALIQNHIYSIVGRPDEKKYGLHDGVYRKDNTFVAFEMLNGTHHLTLMADWNHKDIRFQNIEHLFTIIAKNAPGSYGMLLIRDDEDKDGYENALQNVVLARGEITFHCDNYLSPCVPKIEEWT